jgi:hypothetical protein
VNRSTITGRCVPGAHAVSPHARDSGAEIAGACWFAPQPALLSRPDSNSNAFDADFPSLRVLGVVLLLRRLLQRPT